MLYPATYNITLLQNSTWRGRFRLAQDMQGVPTMEVTDGTPTFNVGCHGYTAGTKIIFSDTLSPPCGIELNTVYYVISAGLAKDSFRVSATEGGSSIAVDGIANGSFPLTMNVGKPLDLTSTTIDADVIDTETSSQIATFTVNVLDATTGYFELTMTPATTLGLTVGDYSYDLSITNGSGERYYYLRGSVTVERTYSRT